MTKFFVKGLRIIKRRLLLACYFIPFFISAQKVYESGQPFVTDFDIRKLIPIPQVWSIAQDDRGIMYFGSTALLQYDGVNWTIIKTNPSSSVVRSMTKDQHGRIYIGLAAEFGYLGDDSSATAYHSLLPFVPKQYRDFNEVWSIRVTPQGVYFQSREFIFRMTPKNSNGMETWEVKTWKSENRFLYSFFLDGIYYIHQEKTGLSMMVNDSIRLIPGGEVLGKNRVQVMLPYDSASDGNKTYLIGDFNDGLFLFNGKKFKRFATAADSLLVNNRLYKGKLLNDGRYAFATSGKGLVLMDHSGKYFTVINRQSGLQDELVRDIYQDKAGALWLGLDYGIARLETSSPLTKFSGANVTNLNSIVKTKEGIYTGTSTGLAHLNERNQRFEKIEGIAPGQVFDLLPDKDRLLVASAGLFYVENGKGHPVDLTNGSLSSYRNLIIPKHFPNILIVGASSSIRIFNRIKEKPYWKFAGQLTGLNSSVSQLTEDKDGTIWIASQLNAALWGLFNYADSMGRVSMEKIIFKSFNDKEYGLTPQRTTLGISNFKGDAVFTDDSNYYRFDKATSRFIRDTVLLKIIGFVGSVYENFVIDPNERIWVSTKDHVTLYTPKPDSGYRATTNPFAFVEGVLSTVTPADSGITWLVGINELYRYDGNKKTDFNYEFQTHIREVIAGSDTLHFDQHIYKDNYSFGYNDNYFHFSYAAAFYIKENQTRYQTWLEGFEKTWSDWGPNTYKEYTNLPEGKYTFHVRAKNIFEKQSADTRFDFSIQPPWYRSWWAYLIYIFLGISLLAGFIRYRSHRLQDENKKLELKVNERTAQLDASMKKLRSTQDQLIQSEKMASLGELTAGIAHEIQNPLNFVNNFSEVSGELVKEMSEQIDQGNLQDAKSIAGDLIQNLDKIHFHGKRADSIVKNMMQHARPAANQKIKTNINELTNEYLSLAYHGFLVHRPQFHATLNTRYDADLKETELMPEQIGRVLLNIFNNAFYEMNEKKNQENGEYFPVLDVSTGMFENMIELRIKDNGNGIPQKILDKIFQPFFTTKPAGQGTGLGLSLSYEMITRAHSGKLVVETKEGAGSVFIILLPPSTSF